MPLLTLVIRNLVILFASLFIHMTLHNIPYLKITQSLFALPVIILLTPIVISRLPIMGTTNLMKSGIMPLFSSVLLVGLAFGYTLLMDIVKKHQNDPLHKILKPYSVGSFTFQGEVIFILSAVVLTELLIQFSILKYSNKKSN